MKKVSLIICIFCVVFNGCVKKDYSSNLSSNSNFDSYAERVNSNDFVTVCNGGKVAKTNEYDKSLNAISPISIYFQSNPDAKYQDEYLMDFPTDWKMDYSKIEKTQLVACINLVERKEKRRCPYFESGKKYQLIMNDTKLNAKVYEAKTGNLVAEKDFDLKADKECPMFEFFTNEEQSEDPKYEQLVINFLKPLVKH